MTRGLWSRILFNVGAIAAAFLFVPIMTPIGWPPMMGLALGTLLGGLLQAGIQWPALHREGFRFRFELKPSDPGMREVLRLMIPGTVGLAAVQINVFVNTVLATSQGTGAVSWLDYAFRLMYLPIGVFGVSIATAALPTISTFAARNDFGGVRQTVSSGLRMMLMLNVPATVGLIALATPIVGLIYERGRFNPADTAATAAALMCYAPGLVGYSAVKIASPTFYALRDSRTPVMVSMASVVANIVLNVTFVRVLGYRGLALGTALAALLNAGLLMGLLRGRIGGLDGKRVTIALVKILAASCVMAVAAAATEHAARLLWPGVTLMPRLVHVLTGIAAGVVTLVAVAKLLRMEEFDQAVGAVLRKGR